MYRLNGSSAPLIHPAIKGKADVHRFPVMESAMQNTSTSKRPLVLGLLTAACTLSLSGPSAALTFDPDLDIPFVSNPPPGLLSYASDAATLESTAGAMSIYKGSLRFTPCSDSGAFWACRDEFDSGFSDLPANQTASQTNNNSVVIAERSATAFDYTDPTPQYNYSYFADITPATSYARARTDFGSNRAQASAWNGRSWTETRVQSAWDPTESTISGYTQALASASSTYTEIFTPDKDGQVILQFELEQHAAAGRPGFSGPVYDLFSGDAGGSLRVQVFDLDTIIEYSWGESFENSRTREGYAIVGRGNVSLDWDEGPGTEFLSLAFDVVAGNRYSVVSQLRVEADDNASADFYGTASLERILVTPGMNLAAGSGTTYAVAAIPEPQTFALMLAGLGLVGWAARRRSRG
jgi:hypothetical protein